MPIFQAWLSISLSAATLCSLIIAATRVVKKQEREWAQNEDRLLNLEKNVQILLGDSKQLTTITAKLEDIGSEMSRMRDRLDRFLDTRAAKP
jgi:uncharacterized protein YoxC